MLKVAKIKNLYWNNGSRNKPVQLPDTGLFKEFPDIDPIMATPYSGWAICEGDWNYAYLNDIGYFLTPISIIDRKGQRIKYALIRDEWAYAVKTNATVKGRVITTDSEELLRDNIQRTKLIIENPSYLNVIKLTTEKRKTLPFVYFKEETFDNFEDEYLINGAIDAFKTDIPQQPDRRENTLYIMRVLQTVKTPSWKRELSKYIRKLINGVSAGEYTLSKVTQQSDAFSGSWTITPKATGKNIGSQSFENHIVVGDIDLTDVVDVEPIGPDGRVAYGKTPVKGENAVYRESKRRNAERVIRNYTEGDYITLANPNAIINPVTEKTASPGAIVGGYIGKGNYQTWVFTKDGILKPFRATKPKEEWLRYVETNKEKIRKHLQWLEYRFYKSKYSEENTKSWDSDTLNWVKREESEFSWDKLVWELPKKGSEYDYAAIYDLLNHNPATLKEYRGPSLFSWPGSTDYVAFDTPSGRKFIFNWQVWKTNKRGKVVGEPTIIETLEDLFNTEVTLSAPNEEFINTFSEENDPTYNNGKIYRPTAEELRTTTNYFRLKGTDYTLVLHNGEASLILPDDKVSATTETLTTRELETKLQNMELLELINQKVVFQIYDKQFELKDRVTPLFRFTGQVETITPNNTLTAFDTVFVYYDGFYDYLKVSVDTPRIDLANVNTNSYLQYENLVIEQQRLKEDFNFKKEQVQLARNKEDNDWQYRWDQYNRSYTQSIANIAINAVGAAVGAIGGMAGGVTAMLGANTAIRASGMGSNAVFQMMDLNAKYNQMKDQEKQMFAARVLENHSLNIEHHRKLFDNLRNIRYMGSNYTQSNANNYDVLKEYNKKIDASNYHLKVYTPTEEQLRVIKEHFNYHGVECAIDDVTLVIDETLYGIWMFDEINAIQAQDEMSREYIKGILTNGIRIHYEPLDFGEPVNKIQPAMITEQINEEMAKLRQQCEASAGEDYEQLKVDKQNLETQLNECKQSKETLEEQVKQLTTDKQSLEQQLQQSQETAGDTAKLRAELTKVKNELTKRTGELSAAKRNFETAKGEYEKKVEELKQADEHLRTAAADAHSKGEAVKRLEGEVEAATKKIQELTTKKEELEGQIVEANSEIAKGNKKVEELTAKKEELEGALLEANNETARANNKVSSLNDDLEQCKSENEQLKQGQGASKTDLEKKLADCNTKLNKKNQDIANQRQRLQTLTEQNKQLAAQIKEKEATITSLNNDLEQCNKNVTAANRTIDTFRTSLNNKEQELTQANNQVNLYRSETNTLKTQIQEKDQEIERLKAQPPAPAVPVAGEVSDYAHYACVFTIGNSLKKELERVNFDNYIHLRGIFQEYSTIYDKYEYTEIKTRDDILNVVKMAREKKTKDNDYNFKALKDFERPLVKKFLEDWETSTDEFVTLPLSKFSQITKKGATDKQIRTLNSWLNTCLSCSASGGVEDKELQAKVAQLTAQAEQLKQQVEDEKAKQTDTDDQLRERLTERQNQLEQLQQRFNEKELELGALKVEVGKISTLTPWEKYRRVFPYSSGSYTNMDEWKRQFTKSNGFNLNPEELKRVGITVNALAAFADWETIRCVVEWQIFNRSNNTFQTKEPPTSNSYFSNWNEDVIVEQLKDNRNWTHLMDTTMNPVTDHQNVNYGERTQLLGGYGAYYYWKNTRDALNKLRTDWNAYKVIDQSNVRKPGLALRILESTYNSPRDKEKATDDILQRLLRRACTKVEDGNIDYGREFNCPVKLNEANQKVRELTNKVTELSGEPDFPTWEQYQQHFTKLNKEQWLQKFTVGNSFRLRLNTFNDFFILISSAYRLYKGQVANPAATDEDNGYKRLRATIELALKNESEKTVLTGKNLPLQWNLLSQEDLKLLRIRAELLYQYVRDGFNYQPQTHVTVKNKFNDFVNLNNKYTLADFRDENKFLEISKKGAEFIDALLSTNTALRLWTGIEK